MKLGKIIDTRFHVALNKLSTEPLPLRVAFKLKGISKQAKDEFAKHEEVRRAALDKYGKKKDDGTLITDEQGNAVLDEASMTAFMKELNDLASLDVQLPKLKLSELGDNAKLSMADLEILEDVIVEG